MPSHIFPVRNVKNKVAWCFCPEDGADCKENEPSDFIQFT